MPVPHPLHEIEPDAALVRALLREQHPDLAGLPLRHVGAGWDNVTWRLGDELAVRLPVRAAAAVLVLHEQRVLPVLAPRLPVRVPLPVRTGVPSDAYPWAWSVVPWLAGTVAAAVPVARRTTWAPALADVLAALHRPAPPDAPVNPYRGVPLATRTTTIRERLGSADPSDRDMLVEAWQDGLAAPPWHGPALWLHGDLHPGNLLVGPDGLAGVLDFGDVTSGDPAADLATAWLTFDARGRAAFRSRLDALTGYDDATWRRARAWAASLVGPLRAHPVQHPLLDAVGRHAVTQLVADR